jgi:hypothetical protein
MTVTKLNLTAQDVRSEVLELRDELVLNLRFIRSVIRKDREQIEEYYSLFKDIKYRPVTVRDNDGNPLEYGSPTEISLEPLASQFRTTVKSLLDSIRLIDSEIVPEEDLEGAATLGGSGSAGDGAARRAQLRESFNAGGPEAGRPATDEEVSELAPKQKAPKSPKAKDFPTKLVQNAKSIVKAPNEGVVSSKESPEPDSKPWRDTVPGQARSSGPVESRVETNHQPAGAGPGPGTSSPELVPGPNEPKANLKPQARQQGAIGLSPALRAQIVGGSRMAEMRLKYEKGDNEEE